LSFGAMPSSSSKHTMSAPLARAFGKISGRSAGTKIKLRRGRIDVLSEREGINITDLTTSHKTLIRDCNEIGAQHK